MPDLRDPLWQFVGAAIGLVALGATIVVFFLQRKRKALSYELVTRTSLLSVKDEVKGRVQILFDGTPITNAHMYVLRLVNTGNVPIEPSDYVRPLRFDFGEMVTILSAEVTETNPRNVDASVETDLGTVDLAPVLLNGGDSITLKVLITPCPCGFDVDSRIVGVKRVQPIGQGQELLFPLLAAVLMLFVLVTGFAGMAWWAWVPALAGSSLLLYAYRRYLHRMNRHRFTSDRE